MTTTADGAAVVVAVAATTQSSKLVLLGTLERLLQVFSLLSAVVGKLVASDLWSAVIESSSFVEVIVVAVVVECSGEVVDAS